MARTRRLDGIAALSAGALASAGLTGPVAAADAPGEDEAAAARGAIPAEVLGNWEAERGIDLPDALFVKVEVPGVSPTGGDAFIKWEYRPGSDTEEPALIKWTYATDEAAIEDAFHKVEFALDGPDGQAALRDLGAAFLKLDGVSDATPVDELFHKMEQAALGSGDAFLKWSYVPDDEPIEDAFYKLEMVAGEPGAGPVFHKWGYDAIDVIDEALVDSIEASIEGDPGRPIAGVLDEVRALGAAAGRVNPFVERDRAMKGLPLPKRLPNDAGMYTTPKAGIWRSVNLRGTVKCGGRSQSIPRSVVERVSLRLEDGGARIVGRDLGERGSRVSLDADSSISGRYTGTVDLKTDGGRVDMDLTMQLVTDERVVGTAEVKVKAGGRTCTVTRRFDMTYRGQ